MKIEFFNTWKYNHYDSINKKYIRLWYNDFPISFIPKLQCGYRDEYKTKLAEEIPTKKWYAWFKFFMLTIQITW